MKPTAHTNNGQSYFAVIFTAKQSGNLSGYAETNAELLDMVETAEGYLGMDTANTMDGMTITISYWKDMDSIKKWREASAHKDAQERGKSQWYDEYQIRICEVHREYGFEQ